RNSGQRSGNVSNAAHVRRKVIDLVNASARCLQAIIKLTQIQHFELVRGARFILGFFDIHAADPIAIGLQSLYKMMANKTPGTGDQYTFNSCHVNYAPYIFVKSCISVETNLLPLAYVCIPLKRLLQHRNYGFYAVLPSSYFKQTVIVLVN